MSGDDKPLKRENDDKDHLAVPGTSQQSPVKNDKKTEILQKAPKLRFDVDLFDWGEKLEAPAIIQFDSQHKFWKPAENETTEIRKEEEAAALRLRKIDYSGEFKPVKWQCRALLPNGKLCPRYDRHKCPFHGVVIARDERGRPTNPVDIERLKKEEEIKLKNKPPDWQDPELLKELKASTGLDLTVKKNKRQKKKKKEYPELTDIKRRNNSPRKRLEKKVLNKCAVKRVASTLDALDHKKYGDKFGDQFNYHMYN